MGGEWSEVGLSDVLMFANGKTSPERSDEYAFPVFGSNGVIGYAKKTNAPSKSLVIGRVGSYCGSVYFSKQESWITDNAIRANAREGNSPEFLYFLLVSLNLNHLRAGSGQPLLNQKILGSIFATIPPFPEQQRIAAVLGALDDKIELNRKMNKTLEAMAQAIFKSWFVDFEPFRDGGMVDSELGPIPKEWEVSTVGKEFRLIMGQSPPGHTYNKDGVGMPFFQGATDFGFRFPTRRVFCTEPKRIAEAGDTLISVRAPVGRPNMATEECCLGRGVAAMRHNSGSLSFTFGVAKALEHRFESFNAEGTVFGSINKKDFERLPVIKPPSHIVQDFDSLVSSLDQKIEINERQSRTLAELRDTLLPKLILGAVRVPESESTGKEAWS